MTTHTFYRSPVAIVLALSLSALAYPTLAQTTPQAPNKTTAAKTLTAQDRELTKLSQEGFQAMRNVRGARIAIFNGNTQVASDLLDKAKTSLDAARKEAPVYVVDVKTGMDGKIVQDSKSVDRLDMIPIDGQIVLADNYIDTPAKKAHIDKANEHFAKGSGKEAREELRLAEVDASFSRVLMPLNATTRHVAEATKLIGAKQFYEANLALKAAEDGLLVDTVVLSESPSASNAVKAKK